MARNLLPWNSPLLLQKRLLQRVNFSSFISIFNLRLILLSMLMSRVAKDLNSLDVGTDQRLFEKDLAVD